MSPKKNIAINLFGSGWTALMSIAFLPIYIKMLGIEAYGIVGLFSSLLVILAVFDLGLPQTITRELAKTGNSDSTHQERRDTVRTFETVYWISAVIIGASIALLSPLIAKYWLKPANLPAEQVTNALRLIGLSILFRWPFALYLGALNGLNKQFQANYIQVITATLQGIGTIAVLNYIENSITTFFLSQALWTVLGAGWLRLSLWSTIGITANTKFRFSILTSVWKFAASVTSISMLSTILSQLDKIILSKVLSLSDFGYYTFATAVASVAFKLISPVFVAYYPKITALASENREDVLAKLYHQGCQAMNFVTLPIGLTLILNSQEILLLWTSNVDLSQNTASILSILLIGNLLNGAIHIPYGLQLAHGWTQLALIQNCIGVVIATPLIYFLTHKLGPIGGASSWALINLVFLLAGTAIMHQKLLKFNFRNWLLQDLFQPTAAAIVAALTYKSLIPSPPQNTWILLYCTGSVISVAVAVIISSNHLRTSMGAICIRTQK